MAPPDPTGALDDAARFDWLRLIRTENVGPRTFRSLLQRYGNARAALAALPELARRGGGRVIVAAPAAEIERELEAARKLGVRFVGLGEPDYPPLLARVDSAPPMLALMGREEALQQPCVAIIGSRNASGAGLAFADRLARGLGEAGYVVVSGLARGIDLRAHTATLATGAVGVLAGGHARPYPPEAIALIPRIAEFGAVVSEMPIGWEPRGRDFPRRNRIVSGLSLGVVVVEAARGSGSLITARFALEQNREVFAVPGSPLDPRAEGTNDLLRDRAHLCASLDDVIGVLGPLRDHRRYDRFGEPPALPFEAGEVEADLWSGEGDDERADAGADLSGDADDRAVAKVRALLGPSPVQVDDLARLSELDLPRLRLALTMLDLAGALEYSGGDRVALRASDPDEVQS